MNLSSRLGITFLALWLGSAAVHASTVRGLLLNGRTPVVNTKVTLTYETTSREIREFEPSVTDGDGMFYFYGVTAKPGAFFLNIYNGEDAPLRYSIAVRDIPYIDVPPIQIDRPKTQSSQLPDRPQPTTLSADEVRAFVQNYFDLHSRREADALSSLYAEQVDYYDEGQRSREYIAKDRKTQFARYAVMNYTVESIDVDLGKSQDATARFNVRYDIVTGAGKKLRGEAFNTWRLSKRTGNLQIVSTKETVKRQNE